MLRASRIGIFGGAGAFARWRMTASMAKASITSETWRCQPCQERVSLWSRPSSFLAVSKPSSIAQRCPSTLTSVSIPVPAGHQVEKKASSPSAMERRIKQAPRPQAGEAVVVLGGLKVGQLEIGPVVEPRTFGPVTGRETRPRRGGQGLGDLLRRAGHQAACRPRS